MVDALIKTKEFLNSGGLLVDVHPQYTPVPIFAETASSTIQVGEIDMSSKIEKYSRADRAIEAVVEMGQYQLLEMKVVDYKVYFDTAEACRRYLAEAWSSVELGESSWVRMSALEQRTEFKQFYYIERVKFCSLSPLIQ